MISGKYSRRRTLQLIGGVAGGALLHACTKQNKTTSPGSSESMSFTLGGTLWIGLTPFFIAQEKGFFAEEDLTVDFKGFSSSADYNAAFLAGQLNAAAPVTSEAVSLAAKGKDYRIVLVESISVGGDGILARTKINSVKDFKGKKIAVEQGTVSHFFLLQVLEEAGLSDADVKFVNAPPAAAAAAYQAGNVDIAVTYSPYMNQADKAQTDGRIIYDSSKMPTAVADVYAFDTQFIEENPQAVEAFVRGIFKGIAFLEEHPEEGLAIAAKKFEVTPEALAADLEGIQLPDAKTNLEMLGNSQSGLYLLNPLNRLATFLSKQGQVEEVPQLKTLLEPRFVEAVVKTQ
jgi:NitT/TauT family transport system substrate-binding protein